MSYFQAILLGLVRGIAEFLPISSSGHQKLFEKLFDLPVLTDPEYIFFDALARVGTLLAVVLAFFPALCSISRELRGAAPAAGVTGRHQAGTARRQILLILFSLLPMLLWIPVEGYLDRIGGNHLLRGLLFGVMGFILYVCDHLPRGKMSAQEMTIFDALFLGLAQLIATLPGLSRPGMTISAGLWRGMNRSFAVQFAFLMYIPAMLVGAIWRLVQGIQAGVNDQFVVQYLLITAISALSGFLALRFLQYMVRRNRFGNFAYYCWGVGLISMVLFLIT